MNPTPPPFQVPDQPDSRENKVRTLWRALVLLYVLGALGLIMYWEFTDQGIPNKICEFQARLFSDDKCYVILNIFGTFILFLIPLFPVKFIVEKISGVKIHPGDPRKLL
jgi:hypothetical protein